MKGICLADREPFCINRKIHQIVTLFSMLDGWDAEVA